MRTAIIAGGTPMPFINTKASVAIPSEKREIIKKRFGEAISLIPGKSENWLMLGFEEYVHMYFAGDNSKPTAFVEVKIFGEADEADLNRLTAAVTTILNDELSIPKDRIYVKYELCSHWGWNGENF